MTSAILISLFLTVAITLLIVASSHWHGKFSHDEMQGVQKFHIHPTPRIGGLSLLLGLSVGYYLLPQFEQHFFLWLLIASTPVFLGGLAEDISGKLNPQARLILAFISAGIAFYGLDAAFIRTGWQWFDQIFAYPVISLLTTVFMVGGVAHSINIIDGFNGLMLGFSVVVLLIFSWIALQVGDIFLAEIFIVSTMPLLGLFIINFPQGKILTGDGGSYLIGFLLAIYALLLVNRNPGVSPWVAICVLCFPIFETTFSMYRRKIFKNQATSIADALHLHTLIYRRLIPQFFKLPKKGWQRNASTSVIVWLLVIPFTIPALWFWGHSLTLIAISTLFCCCYVIVYFKIVRFKIKR